MELLDIRNSELKQVIVIRTDLKMGKGKLCAQVAHASLSAYLEAKRIKSKSVEKWLNKGMKKIVLKVNNEKELFLYFQQTKDAHLPTVIIYDAGLTQIEGGRATCFGIGPANADEIDKIVGKLKLL